MGRSIEKRGREPPANQPAGEFGALVTRGVAAAAVLDFFWWWNLWRGQGEETTRRQQRRRPSRLGGSRKTRSASDAACINNNNNTTATTAKEQTAEEKEKMLGAAQDQLAPIRLSGHTLDKATKAKVTLENYYSNLIAQNVERQQRLAKLEETLRDEGLSETQKQEKRQQHAIKETEFLRLKRSRLGVEDFEPLKGIII